MLAKTVYIVDVERERLEDQRAAVRRAIVSFASIRTESRDERLLQNRSSQFSVGVSVT